jgi:hypothetical protein
MFIGLQSKKVDSRAAYTLKTSRTKAVYDHHPLLAISEHKRSGLILCKAYHAEFAGPGALVGAPLEQGYTAVITIGAPEIVEVHKHEERQKAYSRRIQWIRWLQKVTDHADPVQRAEKLLSGFEAFFDRQVVASLPDEALALLIGVLPQTIGIVRSQYRHPEFSDEANLGSTRAESTVLYFGPQKLPAFRLAPAPFTISASFLESLYTLPYSA